MKKQLIRATATAVLATGLTAGMASFAAADINTTGNSSQNTVKSSANYSAHVVNSNNLGASNYNSQASNTGSASTNKNTTSGNVTTGSANNQNTFGVQANVDNTGSANEAADTTMPTDPASLGSIGDTGYDSTNTISATQTTNVSVNNQNNVQVSSTNNQHASSGNASSNENTTSGNVMTGNASNSTTSEVDLTVNN